MGNTENLMDNSENQTENIAETDEEKNTEAQGEVEDDFDGDDMTESEGDETEGEESAEGETADVTESTAENEEPAEIIPAAEGEDAAGDSVPKKKSKAKVVVLSCIIGIAVILTGVYFGGVIYYSSRFLPGTEIGSFDCSNMTVEEAQSSISRKIDDYTFTFNERDGKKEVITGSEIHLATTPAKNLGDIKAEQNAFKWFMKEENLSFPLDMDISYNEDSLYNRISEMDFMAQSRETMKGTNEKIKYVDGSFTVVDEDGTEIVSQNYIYRTVKPKIYDLYEGMSLEQEGCYMPISEDDTMKGVINALNKYAGTKVTYKKGDAESAVLDGSTINEWLYVTDDFLVRIDPEKVKTYVNELSKSYDTAGGSHKFKTTGGGEITVSGGDYGWLMNNLQESEELLNIIRSGETVEREPVYKKKGLSFTNGSDIGSTYAEVSLGAQHLWYYKNGSLVVSSDFVSGNPQRGNATPSGVYSVKYKAKNVVLRGPGYESPVTFWMPFNGGIGFHDASWRSSFGGSIYNGGGSHGCVNLPYSAASALYNSISSGEPVVVY